ncbi:hypothetical protein M426DRAFT_269040 [Hypoxylon sp. CI-4A]|nr:hypothetical protein M426DRAFT_269040 [Hypoxylon sp. CI-4A]
MLLKYRRATLSSITYSLRATGTTITRQQLKKPLLASALRSKGIKAMSTNSTESPSLPGRGSLASSPSESIPVKNVQVNEASGVRLSSQQKLLVGSVLDLFEGNPTLKHLSLWSQQATFKDPLTIASGHKQFAAQWYGLAALFHPIEIQHHSVVSGGNPMEINLSNKYTLKGVGMSQTVDSVVRIYTGQDGKIESVEDRWNDKLEDGAIRDAFRKLNAKTVPNLVTVPQNEEEDLKLQAARKGSA